jgi:hypothetical protein
MMVFMNYNMIPTALDWIGMDWKQFIGRRFFAHGKRCWLGSYGKFMFCREKNNNAVSVVEDRQNSGIDQVDGENKPVW